MLPFVEWRGQYLHHTCADSPRPRPLSTSYVRWGPTGSCGSRTQLVAATDEVRLLGGVTGQLDGPVVRRPRLLASAQPAQQVGARGVVGVVALKRHVVHLG